MKRHINQQLKAWKRSKNRKPLILQGVRQVGKTYALLEFAKTAYDNFVYLNFEKNSQAVEQFSTDLEPYRLLEVLSIRSGETIVPGRTLIILDEIQRCPVALNALKYFHEEANEYHIVAAGSLLGVRLAEPASFPVGKVNFMSLYPMTFFEFLLAVGKEKYLEYLTGLKTLEPIINTIHHDLLELLKRYFYVGGMPEAVATYRDTRDFKLVREIQSNILRAYEYDFSKYPPRDQAMKIAAVWEQVPLQLAKENKKFIFSAIRKSARGRDYEEAIQWLIAAGLLHKSSCVSTPKLPIKAYANQNHFKLFMCDVGLQGAMSQLSAEVLLQKNELFTEFNGALTENYVAQELIACGYEELYYWSSKGTAEIDFLLPTGNTIIPLEVKAGNSNKKKSLLVYQQKFKPSKLMRTTQRNLKQDTNLINCPLYLIALYKSFLSGFPFNES